LNTPQSVLTPATVAAIDDLELAARLVVEGARSGSHRSPFHGFTAEFSQHRPYRPGDDLKYLDWKLLGRTDRLYSRQFRETTSLSVMVVVDTSASMSFPEAAGDVSKFRYASILAAAIAWLVIGQGDSAGVMTTNGDRLTYVPAKGGRPHLRSVLAQIARLEPAGAWALDRAIARGADLLRRRGVVLVISDFYDAGDSTFRELRRVARRGHDVALLQVLSRPEIDFPYAAHLEFEDLESGERRVVDAGAAGREYRSAVAEFLTRCRRQAHGDGIDYALMPTDVAPERALRTYLLRREATASAGPSAARERP
jgi:uncharacterized protein (DUF58 family)